MVIRQYLSYEVSVTFLDLLFWVLDHHIIVIDHSNGHIAQIAISLKHPNNFNILSKSSGIRKSKRGFAEDALLVGTGSSSFWRPSNVIYPSFANAQGLQ